ncbi:MAG: TadE/TadG family type IV pilus assembly protein [Bacillota bacterium]|nr:TadE/TadG family type IV pilus assembly protein [Bacillota bacterium]
MKGKRLSKFKEEQGQSMVEFALVIPLLLLLILGIIDFGWIYHSKIQLDDASNIGARYAITLDNSQTSQNQIKSQIYSALPNVPQSNLTITITYSSGTTGNVTISINENVTPPGPLTNVFAFNNAITLKSSTTMKMS